MSILSAIIKVRDSKQKKMKIAPQVKKLAVFWGHEENSLRCPNAINIRISYILRSALILSSHVRQSLKRKLFLSTLLTEFFCTLSTTAIS